MVVCPDSDCGKARASRMPQIVFKQLLADSARYKHLVLTEKALSVSHMVAGAGRHLHQGRATACAAVWSPSCHRPG